MRPPSDGVSILGVPLGSPSFVSNFIRKRMDAIDEPLALSPDITDGRTGHNIQRATASAWRMKNLLRLIPASSLEPKR